MMPDDNRSNQSLLKTLLVNAGLITLVVVVVLWMHQVPREITAQDDAAIAEILGADISADDITDYMLELAVIGRAQRAVLNIAPVYLKIPKGQSREPADLLAAGHGYCFDRARSMDKILRSIGFETRYASLYSIDKAGSPLKALMRKGGDDVRSHAVVEVLTSRGWLVMDTIHPWLAQDAERNPVGLADLKDGVMARGLGENVYFLYKMPFTYVYGLYSRHGRAYAPYNLIPDVNWWELRHNIF